MSQLMDLEVFETLKELSVDDPTFLKKIIDLYLAEMPLRLVKLQEEFKKGDAQGVAHASHALVSASQNIGAVGLAHLSLELENIGRAGSIQGADKLIPQIILVFNETKQFLDKALEKHGVTRA